MMEAATAAAAKSDAEERNIELRGKWEEGGGEKMTHKGHVGNLLKNASRTPRSRRESTTLYVRRTNNSNNCIHRCASWQCLLFFFFFFEVSFVTMLWFLPRPLGS